LETVFRRFLFILTLDPKPSTIFMQELIDKLKTEAGLTDEQAKKAIETIKSFVVDKFPMLEGAIGNLFGNG
jgi:hypothetical protein